MPETPPKATIYLVNIASPELLKRLAIGIDLNFFNFETGATPLKGIKLIDAGLHFVHYTNLNLELRSGLYIEMKEGHVYFFNWNTESEEFEVIVVDSNLKVQGDVVPRKRNVEGSIEDVDETSLNVTKWIEEVKETYQLMINYEALAQQSGFINRDWKMLTSKITMTSINRIFPGYGSSLVSTTVSTIDASKQENEKLLKQLHESISKRLADQGKDLNGVKDEPIIRALKEDQDRELGYTTIDLKYTADRSASRAQVTEQSMDKSRYLDIILSEVLSEDAFLQEFQICFVNIMLLNNYNSGEQWLDLIKVTLMSFQALKVRTGFYVEFFKNWELMLRNLSKDLVQDDDKEGIVKLYDMEFLRALKSFQSFAFYEMDNTPAIKVVQKLILSVFDILRTKFDVLISLDDDENLDQEQEDYSDDEYKPVIVSI